MDMFGTIADIITLGLPEDKDVAPDSYSFLSSLMGQKSMSARTSLVTADMHGMQAIRMGDWKYIDNVLPEELPESRRKNIKMPLEPQLYNLSEDPAESNNLYEENPDLVQKLKGELTRIREASSTR